MFEKLVNWFKRPVIKKIVRPKKSLGILSSDVLLGAGRPHISLDDINAKVFQRTVNNFTVHNSNVALDSSLQHSKEMFSLGNNFGINAVQLDWFASQSFIGYQTCALLAQNWLIDKACTMPAEDAVRKGYGVTKNDGKPLSSEIKDAILQTDAKYKLNESLVEFVRMGRIFGIRIAMFVIDAPNKYEYYKNPFNPDSIQPGSYRGISQIDPYWITPELDQDAAANPSSKHFYEPTWWRVSSDGVSALRVHRTHLIIMRNSNVPDILKPSYFYGGVPLPQQIYNRIYAAERTANEAPLLALTKRSIVYHTDLERALANQGDFEDKIRSWTYFLDNFGIKLAGKDEKVEQFDTALGELDAVIMTQYQLVAAIAKVPVTKLLGTVPKGFNATGEFDESSYHESLESIQTHYLTPLIQRHHLLMIRSEIAPQFNIAPFDTTIQWKPLDAMTSQEQANVNKLNAETDQILITCGAIEPSDARQRVINDPASGYDGLTDMDLENEPDEDDSTLVENENPVLAAAPVEPNNTQSNINAAAINN